MVDSRDFYGRSFVTPSVQNPVINPISPPSDHMRWNNPNHHPQPFNTDYQIPRYSAYSNNISYTSDFSTGNLERLNYAAIDQTDLGLKSIITNLPDSDKSSFSHLSSTNHFCDCSEGGRAASYCRDCDDYLCQRCEDAHRRTKITKTHRIESCARDISKNDFDTENMAFNNMNTISKSYFCQFHSEECNYWCIQCNRPCCDSCIIDPTHHANHETIRLSETQAQLENHAKKVEREENLMGEAKSKKIKIKKEIDEIIVKRSEAKSNYKEAVDKIKNAAKLAKMEVEKEERRLLSSIERIQTEIMSKSEEKLEKLKETDRWLQKYIQNISPNKTNSRIRQIIEDEQDPYTFMNFTLTLHSSEKIELGKISSLISVDHTLVSGNGIHRVLTPSYNGDWNQFTICPKGILDEPIDNYTHNDFKVTITPDPARISFEPEKYYLTVKWSPKLQANHKIEITYRNRPLKNSPWTAHWIASRDYTELNHPDFKPVVIGREGTGPGEFSRPWGVCALPNGRFAVADRSNNRFQIFDPNGRHLLSHPANVPHRPIKTKSEIENEPEVKGVFNRPAGICFSYHPEPSILIADKDNHQVQIYSYHTTSTTSQSPIVNLLRIFGKFGSADGEFQYPWDVAVNTKGQIAVSDSRNHRVQLFDYKGNFLTKYGAHYPQKIPKHFDYPRGLCFDNENRLFITDFNIHRINVLNQHLSDPLQWIGASGVSPGRYERPQGITFDLEGRIIICDTKQKRIQILHPKGRGFDFYMAYSGNKNNFSLSRPAGVCVTTFGKIIVVEEDEKEGNRVVMI